MPLNRIKIIFFIGPALDFQRIPNVAVNYKIRFIALINVYYPKCSRFAEHVISFMVTLF